MARRKKKWKPPISDASLNILFECWAKSSTKRECIENVKRDLPKILPPVAWGIIRKISKIDNKWILEGRKKERKKEEAVEEKIRKRKERQSRKLKREQKKKWKEQKEEFKKLLKNEDVERLKQEIEFEFFFCPDLQQQVNNISCIYRIFSVEQKYGFVQNGSCLKCKRMDKYIPVIKKIIGDKNES